VVTKKEHPKPAKHKKTTTHSKKEVAHTVKRGHVALAAHHKAGTVVKTAALTAGHASIHRHVDLALEDVHVNLRHANRKHHIA
jgi:hypothetical protein